MCHGAMTTCFLDKSLGSRHDRCKSPHKDDRENAMADESTLVHSFQKNALEEVRISISSYKGRKYLDIRVYYQGDDGEYKPSKQGVALSPELLPELETAIAKLKQHLE